MNASKAKAKGQLAQPPGGRAATSRQQAGNQQGKRRAHTHKQNETAIQNKVPVQGHSCGRDIMSNPEEVYQITERLGCHDVLQQAYFTCMSRDVQVSQSPEGVSHLKEAHLAWPSQASAFGTYSQLRCCFGLCRVLVPSLDN